MPDAAIFLLPDLGSSFPGAIFDFLASYSSTSFAGKFPTAGSWKHKLCSKERLSQLRLFNSLPVILPVFTKRRTGQSVPEKDVRSQIQNCRWENHWRVFLFHGAGWFVSTGRKGWGWAGIDNSDLITTILILVFIISWSSHEKSIIIAVPEWPRIWRGGISLTAWALNDAGPRKVDSPICPSCFPVQPDQSVTLS